MENTKTRMMQENVPGKQSTRAHIIVKPDKDIYKKRGLPDEYNDASGILTITPSEASIIAGDLCTKAADVKVGFIDRFSGSVVIVGNNSSVEASLKAVLSMFSGRMRFDTVELSRS